MLSNTTRLYPIQLQMTFTLFNNRFISQMLSKASLFKILILLVLTNYQSLPIMSLYMCVADIFLLVYKYHYI